MSGPHFRIRYYDNGRIFGSPLTPRGWVIFTGYVLLVSLIIAVLSIVALVALGSMMLFAASMIFGTLALVYGLIAIMRKMGEVIDDR